MIHVEFCVKENRIMQQHTTVRMQDLAAREQQVYSKIPGMKELLRTSPIYQEVYESQTKGGK